MRRVHRARSREDRPAYACSVVRGARWIANSKSEEVKKRERIGRQGVGRDLGRGEEKKKRKEEKGGGSEEAGRKPEFLHTRARPTRHPSISFDAHFAYAQHAFSPRHLPPPFLPSSSLSLSLHVTYHYMVTILGIQGYNKRVIFHRNDLSSLLWKRFFLPPRRGCRGEIREGRENFSVHVNRTVSIV